MRRAQPSIYFLLLTAVNAYDIINPSNSTIICPANNSCNVYCDQICTNQSIYAANGQTFSFNCSTSGYCQHVRIYAMDSPDFNYNCYGNCNHSELHIVLKNESSVMNFHCSGINACHQTLLSVDFNIDNIMNMDIIPILPSIRIDCASELSCSQTKFYLSSLKHVDINCHGAYSCSNGQIDIVSFDYTNSSLRTSVNVECFAFGSCRGLTIDALRSKSLNITCDQQDTTYVNTDNTCDDMILYAPNYFNGIDKNIYLNCNSYFDGKNQCEGLLIFAMYGTDQFEYTIREISNDYLSVLYGARFDKQCFVGNGTNYYQSVFKYIDFASNEMNNCNITDQYQYNIASLNGKSNNATDISCTDYNKNCIIFAGQKQNPNDITELVLPKSMTCSDAIDCYVWCTLPNSCSTWDSRNPIYMNGAQNLHVHLMDYHSFIRGYIYGNVGAKMHIHAYHARSARAIQIYGANSTHIYLSCLSKHSCYGVYIFLDDRESITIECGPDYACWNVIVYIKADINTIYDLHNITNITVKNEQNLLSPIPYHRIKWICHTNKSCADVNRIAFQYDNQTEFQNYWLCKITYWDKGWYCNGDYPLYIPNYPNYPTINPTMNSVSPSNNPTNNPTQLIIFTESSTTTNTVSPSNHHTNNPTELMQLAVSSTAVIMNNSTSGTINANNTDSLVGFVGVVAAIICEFICISLCICYLLLNRYKIFKLKMSLMANKTNNINKNVPNTSPTIDTNTNTNDTPTINTISSDEIIQNDELPFATNTNNINMIMNMPLPLQSLISNNNYNTNYMNQPLQTVMSYTQQMQSMQCMEQMQTMQYGNNIPQLVLRCDSSNNNNQFPAMVNAQQNECNIENDTDNESIYSSNEGNCNRTNVLNEDCDAEDNNKKQLNVGDAVMTIT